ncbi:MAG: type IV pilus assembly protein PilO [Limisphaerales bacterium]|jgi:type IV pilus assembly protein PilO
MALQDSLDQLKSVDFNDLDLNNIGTWPTIVKIILMIILIAVVLGGGYYLHVVDKQASLDTVTAQEETLRKQYKDKAAQAANLEAYRQQKQEMEAAFGALLRQLPSDTEVPGLLEDITRTAVDHELRIESIDLNPEKKTEFYVELPIAIVVEGDFHKIGSFVSGVANLSRIVTLHDFVIAPQRDSRLLRMEILAKTYRYLEEAK